jgi:hypothetical protein
MAATELTTSSAMHKTTGVHFTPVVSIALDEYRC